MTDPLFNPRLWKKTMNNESFRLVVQLYGLIAAVSLLLGGILKMVSIP